MMPIAEIPLAIETGLQSYRGLFCRDAGFEHVGRYVTGLTVSPNKTLQAIHDLQAWPEDEQVSGRAMHAAVFEAGRQSDDLMPRRREQTGAKRKGKGRHTISLDRTFSRHDRGPEIFGVKKGYGYVKGRYGLFQTVLTAAVANPERFDGIEAEVRQPEQSAKEKVYLKETAGQDYDSLEAAHARQQVLMRCELHCRRCRKITEMAADAVRLPEDEGHFPGADYAFGNGVLSPLPARLIEERGKHRTSELEVSRHINWKGKWRRIDEAAAELKDRRPESFRRIEFCTRSGEIKVCRGFSKAVRLKRCGKKRILIAHEDDDLSDTPRFLVADALHREG